MEACGANFSVEELESLSRMFSFEELQCRSSDILSSNLTVTDEALSGLHHNGIDCLTSFPCDHNYLLPSMEYQTFNEPSMDGYLSFFSQNDDVVTSCFPIREDIIMKETLRMVNQENLKIAETGISDSYNEAWLKRKCIEKSYSEDDKSANNASENPSKKARVSGNHPKNNKRAAQSRKKKKVMQSNEEDTIINSAREEENIKKQSSSSCSVDDGEDSNIAISQELSLKSETKIRSLSSNGKARATRGSASDSQCLYARRRRERINERLRILQSLVPNGTKVDISTMLEEAVHYVKLLQLQIKLLSSDELWMYAPIAYNGIMETGMYRN